MISRFRRDIYGICALLSCYTAYSSKSLLTFRQNLWVPSSGLKKSKYKASHRSVLCVISGFRRDGDEFCALLGCYTACSGKSLPKFRDNLSVPSSGIKNSSEVQRRAWPVSKYSYIRISKSIRIEILSFCSHGAINLSSWGQESECPKQAVDMIHSRVTYPFICPAASIFASEKF